MPFLMGFRRSFSLWLLRLLGRKRTARIGIYGPPNAGKTTLANRILRDWAGEAMGSVSPIPHETRRARKREGVIVSTNGRSVSIDVVDTPGLATKIDFQEFMAHGLSEEEAKRRAKEATEGVIEAVKWLDDLDGVVLVMDATQDPFTQVNVVVVGNMEARELPLIIAANKIDLDEANPQRIESAFPQHVIVPISALEGTNIDDLYAEITRRFGR
ncbi:MAG: Era-like GTP-binding protein [Methermicoccaceae archaeon]